MTEQSDSRAPAPSTIYRVVNPATGQLVRTVPEFTDTQIDAAIADADVAQRNVLSTYSVSDRAAMIRRVGELHTKRRAELAAVITEEMGKPIAQALEEIDFCAAIYEYFADNAESMTADEPIALSAGEGGALLRRSPIGVVLGIMPWNYPYYQVSRFAAPNLILGNSVMLKPAPQCPTSAMAIEDIFRDAGFPPGAYTTVYLTNDQVASALGDPRVQGVSVTGSERAGSTVAAVAGQHVKKVVLELGGSDPFLLLSTDDLDAVVSSAVAARLENAGQACNAAKRFIVIDDLHDAFLAKLTASLAAVEPGDPTDPATGLGPLSSAAAADRLEAQLARAVTQGATLVAGGQRRGNFFTPAVLTGVAPAADAYREEFFGPVAVVYRVASETEAVDVANATPFGLGSYLFTTDPEQAARVADQIQAGMVWINVVGGDAPELPFGGVKRSGFGRELGSRAADEFANKKMIRNVPVRA